MKFNDVENYMRASFAGSVFGRDWLPGNSKRFCRPYPNPCSKRTCRLHGECIIFTDLGIVDGLATVITQSLKLVLSRLHAQLTCSGSHSVVKAIAWSLPKERYYLGTLA